MSPPKGWMNAERFDDSLETLELSPTENANSRDDAPSGIRTRVPSPTEKPLSRGFSLDVPLGRSLISLDAYSLTLRVGDLILHEEALATALPKLRALVAAAEEVAPYFCGSNYCDDPACGGEHTESL